MRSAFRPAFILLSVCTIVGATVPCAAQGQAFGIGPRLSMVRSDVDAGTSADRFTGGQIRARLSPRTAVEVSLDRRSETFEALNERVRDIPLQASLLLYPARSTFSPYLLGGPGWYSHRVETLAGSETIDSVSTRKFGWHAGFGAELRLGRHAGLHADYRYTFLRFGDDEAPAAGASGMRSNDSFVSSLLPSYEGSMWTAGVTIYF